MRNPGTGRRADDCPGSTLTKRTESAAAWQTSRWETVVHGVSHVLAAELAVIGARGVGTSCLARQADRAARQDPCGAIESLISCREA